MKTNLRYIFIIAIMFFIYNNKSSAQQAKQWWNVGAAGFSDSTANYTSIAIDRSGTPYVVYSDGSYLFPKATVKKFDGSNWVTVGETGFSKGEVAFTDIAVAPDGTPYVVYQDYSNIISHPATVETYDGANWVYVGSPGFSTSTASFTSIAVDGSGTPYVVYQDYAQSGKATMLKYNGSSWSGTAGFTSGQAGFTTIAIDDSDNVFVAYEDQADLDKATVMKYNGSGWSIVGSEGFSDSTVEYTSIAVDDSGTPYVAYKDFGNSQKATVKKFNGSKWVTVGSAGFSKGAADYISIAIGSSGTPYVAYSDKGNSSETTVMKFNGSKWMTMGTAGFSAGISSFVSMAIAPDGIPVVAYQDNGNFNKATVMKFSASQSAPLPVELENFTASVRQNQVTLKWNTASEVNNKGFEIQRSAVGRQKSEVSSKLFPTSGSNLQWQKIGFVKGSGSSISVNHYSFVDKNLTPASYSYRLKMIDDNGSFKYSKVVNVSIKVPDKYSLNQNYPNPFNPTTTIKFELPEAGHVKLIVYNMLGQKVTTLVNGFMKAGSYNETFNGDALTSGAYIYRLTAKDYVKVRKMILLK